MEGTVQMCQSDSIEDAELDTLEKENEGQTRNGNPGLADALAKVIRMGKNKNGKSIVLSKAKLYNSKPLAKETRGFEIVSEIKKEIKSEVDIVANAEDIKPSKKKLKKFKITKQEKLQRGKLKPSPLDREKERPLVKIATRGVVQLFNAVRQQQSVINQQINKPGLTESKKEKILKSVDKKTFLDVLMGKTRNKNESPKNIELSNNENEVKSESEEEGPSWKVLRDDFMMGAKLKDWDKKELEIMEE